MVSTKPPNRYRIYIDSSSSSIAVNYNKHKTKVYFLEYDFSLGFFINMMMIVQRILFRRFLSPLFLGITISFLLPNHNSATPSLDFIWIKTIPVVFSIFLSELTFI